MSHGDHGDLFGDVRASPALQSQLVMWLIICDICDSTEGMINYMWFASWYVIIMYIYILCVSTFNNGKTHCASQSMLIQGDLLRNLLQLRRSHSWHADIYLYRCSSQNCRTPNEPTRTTAKHKEKTHQHAQRYMACPKSTTKKNTVDSESAVAQLDTTWGSPPFFGTPKTTWMGRSRYKWLKNHSCRAYVQTSRG